MPTLDMPYLWGMSRVFLFIAICLSVGCNHQNTPTDDSKTSFTLLESKETNISFRNDLKESDSFNIIQYLYFYNGSGVAAGDINNDGLVDLFFGSNMGENQLYLNKGNLQFKNITQSAGIKNYNYWTTGITMADINADGWLDIFVCAVGEYKSFKGKPQLYINNKNNTFTESSNSWGLDLPGLNTQAAFFDFDRDGDLDCYLLRHSVHHIDNYRDTSIRNQKDIYAGDLLLENKGNQFVDISATAGIRSSPIGYGLGISASDFNMDGWIDIYVSNDFHENDYLYLNNQNGSFTEVSRQSMGHVSQFSMGTESADLNGDLLPDIVTLDMRPYNDEVLKNSQGPDPFDIFQFKLDYGYLPQFPHNCLQLNQGTHDGVPRFSEVAAACGIEATDWSWSVLAADLDNDAQQDLFITNGIVRRPNDLEYLKFISSPTLQSNASDSALAALMPEGKTPNFAFRNTRKNGKLQFENYAKTWGLDQESYSNGASFADLDNDGDLDLITNNLNAPASIYRNNTFGSQWLQVELSGRKNTKNDLGAKVILFQKDHTQIQECMTTRGFMSAVSGILHFGLGNQDKIDSILVQWSDGNWEKFLALPINKKVHLHYGKGSFISKFNIPVTQYLQGISLSWKHQEDAWFDTDVERLKPRLYGQSGPALATGDVNGDALEDIFLGGARGQMSTLLLQQKDGSFREAISQPWNTGSSIEKVCALFFDADNDRDLDLIIGTAGHFQEDGDPSLADQLYLNDGKGQFTPAPGNSLPAVFLQTTSIHSADIEKDGDLDLLITHTSGLGSYGLPAPQTILINNGKATFEDRTLILCPALDTIGMVNNASFTDLDSDGLPEIVLAGDWMPVVICWNKKNQFSIQKFDDLWGWWNQVKVVDVNADNQPDLLLGNLGENHDLRVSVQEPLQLYLRDFDQNGDTEPIITWYRHHREVLYPGRDELAMQMPPIKKLFNSYRDYAGVAFNEVFPGAIAAGAYRRKVTSFQSVCLLQKNKEWKSIPLPWEAQLSTVLQFIPWPFQPPKSNPSIYITGNLLEMRPAIGRMDAFHGLFVQFNNQTEKFIIPKKLSTPFFQGKISNAAILKSTNTFQLVLAGNQQHPLVYPIEQEPLE